jgi:hypothetical protein
MDMLLCRDPKRIALVPATDLDRERLRAIRLYDQPMQVTTKFARTGKLNRYYRGLVARVAEAIDVVPELLHNELKFRAGLIAQLIPVSSAGINSVAVKLRSTAYPTMDDGEFARFVDIAIELICRDYLGHVRSRERRKLIIEWVGHKPRLDPSIPAG